MPPKVVVCKNGPTRGDGPVCAYGCGKTNDLKWAVCPYQADIHESDVWAWRCEECMHEAAMDI